MATLSATAPAADRADWRLEIPEHRRRPIRIWLWSIAALTFGVLVVGGITRLTLSGLSIVSWDPLFGVIPPLSEADWQAAFDAYRQFPDYDWRTGMSLAEFKVIFFWEYLHRLLARLIGFVFLVPFLWFWARGYFNRALTARALALFALGGMQGVMGWFMVMSGLVDRPSVSHYRLAAHLSLAFIIFGYALWLARDLSIRSERAVVEAAAHRMLLRGLALVGMVLCVQIVWGAFVAGLRAGKFYPTFPLMGGRLVPAELLRLDPLTRNFVENPIAVQWTHRVIGTVLLVTILVFVARVLRTAADAVSRRVGITMLSLISMQYLLGILTLVFLVPVSLGVIHQAVALVIFGTWLWWLHHVRNVRVMQSHG
ncbi:MAG TPA: COX15/CtaA family protein [Longimicrobiales bacterium]|nr:COX15/CtaA family protein [Longimicrobiales bacterium]